MIFSSFSGTGGSSIRIGQSFPRLISHPQSVGGGLSLEGLDIFRWRKFTAKAITGNTSVHVKSLPPTSDSEKFHSLRVYNQCQKWMSETVDIEPTDWGWEIKRGKRAFKYS
jgi:hypothetical protein